MRTFSANSRQGQNILSTAVKHEGYTLRDVYKKHSYSKHCAWFRCLQMCNEENGTDFHICSHNSFQFSVAWKTLDGWRVETANNSYLVRT